MIKKKNQRADLRWKQKNFFSIGLLFALAATLAAFEYRTVAEPHTLGYDKPMVDDWENEIPPISIPKPPPPPPPTRKAPSEFKIVDDATDEEEYEIPDLEIDQDTKVTYEAPVDFPEEVIVDEDIPIRLPQEMPEYPGGEDSLFFFLMRSTSYPLQAKMAGIQGKVYVTFVIEKDGTVSNVELLKGIGGGCDEEAMRVVHRLAKWKPGKQMNKPVRVRMNLPIHFILK